MSPQHCAYCGTLAEYPVQLRWVLERGAGGVSIPLCLACSRSWCPMAPSPPESATAWEEGPDVRRQRGRGRRAA